MLPFMCSASSRASGSHAAATPVDYGGLTKMVGKNVHHFPQSFLYFNGKDSLTLCTTTLSTFSNDENPEVKMSPDE